MKKKEILKKTIDNTSVAVFIVNTKSRKGKKLFGYTLKKLEECKFNIISFPVSDPSQLQSTVKKSIDKGYKLIIVGGGNGTISSILPYFVNKKVVLGLLPLGTGNGFARTLGIPIKIDDAIDVIVNGKVADVDIGKVGKKYFANLATIGITGEIAKRITPEIKRKFGVLTYIIFGLLIFFSYKPFLCEIRSHNKKISFYTYQVITANGEFFGIKFLGPRERIDNKKLFVTGIIAKNRLELIKVILSILFKRGRYVKGVYKLRTEKVDIHTTPSQLLDIDGELSFKTPVSLKIVPNGLHVMVPRHFIDRP